MGDGLVPVKLQVSMRQGTPPYNRVVALRCLFSRLTLLAYCFEHGKALRRTKSHPVPGEHRMDVQAVPPQTAPHKSFWLWVMCLTGVDYFSTLGYQPSIAVQNAGLLAPLATVVLVLVTLFGALPVYLYVAGRSFEGQGSIGMLAQLVSGWWGKVIV